MSDVIVEVTHSERINVGDGVTIPSGWNVVANDEPNVGGTIRLHVVFDEQLRRTVATSVRLDRAGEGDEVTAAALRDVRVQYLVIYSSIKVVTVTRETGVPESFNEYLAELESRADLTYEETVREAVTLYRLAVTVNAAPLKLVSEQLGVSVSTATRMMARAREAGLAKDLIARETYDRMPAAYGQHAPGSIQPPGGTSGPSLGR